MERLVGHINARPYEGLMYRRPKELRAISFVDSDYAKNTENRMSILSGLHTIGGWYAGGELGVQDTSCGDIVEYYGG